ncbi:MAG: hypothetical protein BIFFINMI_01375 [Phycisphaerae bacterium]|nr:hypothetical protein [Phycisphaerae bacterium]
MKQSQTTTFMTGATGFLGQFVLRDLLARGRRIVVMLRAPLAASVARLTELMAALGVDLADRIAAGRVLPVEGGLPGPLPEPTWGRTDEILASAASLQLYANGNGEPYETNVEGAAALIAWAARHGVPGIHAVSTAYVCGKTSRLVREVFHHPQPDFATAYEQSKWQAERMLADWSAAPGRCLTVMRPSMIVGDATNGYSTQFGGFYQFARMLCVLKKQYGNGNGHRTHIPLRLPGGPDEPQNFVPVDAVSRMTAEIVCDPSLHGRIYHLTPVTPTTNQDIKEAFDDYFNIDGGQFTGCENLDGPQSAAETLMWGQAKPLTERVGLTPHFDHTNSRQVMEREGVGYPTLDRAAMFRLLEYAVTHNWGTGNGNGR